MKTQIIGIKQLHRDLKKITQEAIRGNSFVVVKNSKPAFKIIPLDQDHDFKYDFSDIKKLQFQINDKNLSKDIDKALY